MQPLAPPSSKGIIYRFGITSIVFSGQFYIRIESQFLRKFSNFFKLYLFKVFWGFCPHISLTGQLEIQDYFNWLPQKILQKKNGLVYIFKLSNLKNWIYLNIRGVQPPYLPQGAVGDFGLLPLDSPENFTKEKRVSLFI